VSPRLLRAVPWIHSFFHDWQRRFRRVNIVAPARTPGEPPAGRKTACFFSGGVDSFYTLVSNLERVDECVFIHGFDFQPEDLAAGEAVVARLREGVEKLGKRLIEVWIEWHAHHVIRPAVNWIEHHGSVLAAVALWLARRYHTMLIATTSSPSWPYPWGSHPALDYLWSTENVRIEHVGFELERRQRTAGAAGNEIAMRYLRVCPKPTAAGTNCGSCEKCLRTMVEMRLCGALGRCRAFDKPLDLEAVARVRFRTASHRRSALALRNLTVQNLCAAELNGDEELARALRTALESSRESRLGRLRRRLFDGVRRLFGRAP
jgi:hypothetical protein